MKIELKSLDYHLFLLVILAVAWGLAQLPFQTVTVAVLGP